MVLLTPRIMLTNWNNLTGHQSLEPKLLAYLLVITWYYLSTAMKLARRCLKRYRRSWFCSWFCCF